MALDWLAFCRPIFFSPLKLQATKSKCAERFSFFRVIRLGCKIEEFDCALAILLGRSHGRTYPCALHVYPQKRAGLGGVPFRPLSPGHDAARPPEREHHRLRQLRS